MWRVVQYTDMMRFMMLCDRSHKVSPNPNLWLNSNSFWHMKNGTLGDIYCDVPDRCGVLGPFSLLNHFLKLQIGQTSEMWVHKYPLPTDNFSTKNLVVALWLVYR